MTLNTSVYVHDEVDALAVFGKCRELLEATSDIKCQIGPRYDENGWSLSHELGQGLPAALAIYFRLGEPYQVGSPHSKWCEDECDGTYHSPDCWIEVTFDTTYSYKEGEEGCGHLHVRLVTELGLWLDVRNIAWSWENEFTGEIHRGYENLPDLAGGGDSASAWFERVFPAILSGVSPPRPARPWDDRALPWDDRD